jgi:hypothetical protein
MNTVLISYFRFHVQICRGFEGCNSEDVRFSWLWIRQVHSSPKLHRLLQTLYTKPSPQCRTYDVECIVELLHSHDQQLTLYHPVEIRKHSALAEAEGPEPHPRDGFEVGWGACFEDTVWSRQQQIDKEMRGLIVVKGVWGISRGFNVHGTVHR